ncbi:MAG: hypothetical protein M1834_006690 [Cirrosporium novae-zelandiae]|nr:MAG: hypothetical protein M1834_006690 [Cirrosporium novae-zelandiae]
MNHAFVGQFVNSSVVFEVRVFFASRFGRAKLRIVLPLHFSLDLRLNRPTGDLEKAAPALCNVSDPRPDINAATGHFGGYLAENLHAPADALLTATSSWPDYPPSTQSDSINQSSGFSSPSNYANDEVVQHLPRGGSLSHSLLHPPSLSFVNSVRYPCLTNDAQVQDVHFQTHPGLFVSPADSTYASISTSPASAVSSTIAYSPLADVFHNGASVCSTDPDAASTSSPFTHVSNYSHFSAHTMSDIKPRMPAFQSVAGMPPPSRSPGTHHSMSPSLVGAARENYTTATPGMNRHNLSPRTANDFTAKPFYSTPRTIDPSINSSISPPSNPSYLNSNNALTLDPTSSYPNAMNSDAPPFEKTKILYPITAMDNQPINVEVQAKIDKGFFQVGSEWTCYRRNYFSVQSSFSLRPNAPSVQLFLHSHRENPEPIHGFYLTISAIQDGEVGKPMGLVQHTPKRIKDETSKPAKLKVLPNPTGSLSSYAGSSQSYRLEAPFSVSGGLQGSGLSMGYDHSNGLTGLAGQTPHQAVFERIQFEKATANNGKRRAAQQYYNLVVELYADLGRSSSSSESRFLKIATKQSAPMIVRGRSPGHYKDRTRDSSSSMGPDGSGGNGDGGPGSTMPPSGGSGGPSRPSISYSDVSGGSRLGGNSYHSPDATQGHSRSASMSLPSSASSASYDGAPASHVPVEMILTAEEEAAIEETPGYQYYPSPILHEDPRSSTHQDRIQLPRPVSSTSEATMRPVNGTPSGFNLSSTSDSRSQMTDSNRRDPRDSPQSNHHRQLPSFGSAWSYGSVGGSTSSRNCGSRFQGVESSRGYYPEITQTAL